MIVRNTPAIALMSLLCAASCSTPRSLEPTVIPISGAADRVDEAIERALRAEDWEPERKEPGHYVAFRSGSSYWIKIDVRVEEAGLTIRHLQSEGVGHRRYDNGNETTNWLYPTYIKRLRKRMAGTLALLSDEAPPAGK